MGFFGGIYLFFHGFRLLQRRRLILDTPFSKIRSASMGMVEVGGLAAGPYSLGAPITEHQCYYYRTLVWEYKQCGKNKQWVKVAGECMHLPFFVDDNTGRMLVDPRGADLDLHRDFEQEFCDSFFTTKEPAPNNVRNFLARHGIATRNKIKVEEYCIKPKNALFILGTLSENPGIEVGPQPVRENEPFDSTLSSGFSLSLDSISFRKPGGDKINADVPAPPMAGPSVGLPHQLIRLSPESVPSKASEMSQQQKIAAALLKAGISSPAAWTAAGVPATGASDQEVQVVADSPAIAVGLDDGSNPSGSSSATPFDLHPPTVLMKGTNEKTFLISWRSQQEVARSLGWKCTLMIFGGPALTLLCLYFFLKVEHLL